jgi:[NiFe] hydrogenase assembly HybE family chaperone
MHEQIEKLTGRFRQIAEERMRDLPFYNEQLQVEAVGFTAIEPGYIGALITPWFINIMLLFEQQPENSVVVGHRYTHKLPCGEKEFMIGDDEVIGRYDFISLVSPTGKYKTQQQAQTFALNKLNALLAADGAQLVDEQPVSIVSRPDKNVSRRSFLTGKKSID